MTSRPSTLLFVLALDDLHSIRGSAVHDLLNDLLSFPPASLRLVALCRRNPPLSLAALRASGQMDEIRLRDLQFTEEETLDAADRLLSKLSEFFVRTHNIRFQLEVLALQALLLEARGDEEEAANRLAKSLEMAQPSGFIRVFVVLGPELAPLLSRLDLDEEGLHYAGQILAALRREDEPARETPTIQSSGAQPLVEPLTPRELEILGLLAERLTNKEIADRLFISPVTVKRHANNIYEKLAVHGRREAVSKALGLGILTSTSSSR